jgi:hypothetical protein
MASLLLLRLLCHGRRLTTATTTISLSLFLFKSSLTKKGTQLFG